MWLLTFKLKSFKLNIFRDLGYQLHEPYFKCWTTTHGWWLPYWVGQSHSISIITAGSVVPRSANYGPQAISGLPLAFAIFFQNKVLLEHSDTRLFIVVHGCFHTAKAELSNWDRDFVSQRTENIYCLAHYRESVPAPGLDENTDQSKYLQKGKWRISQGSIGADRMGSGLVQEKRKASLKKMMLKIRSE